MSTRDAPRLKILHLSDNYPPSKGGLERSVQSLAAVQAASGHRVSVVTTELPGQRSHSVEAGVTVHRLPFHLRRLPGAFLDIERVFFPPVPDPIFERALMAMLRSDPPDVIHVHGWILYSTLRPARKLGIPVVSTAHDYGSVCAVKTLYKDGTICSGPALAKCVACAYGSYGIKGVPVAIGLRLSSYRHRQVDEWTGLSAAIAQAGSAPRPRDRQEMTVIPSFVPDSVVNVDPSVDRPSFVPPNGPYALFVGAMGVHKGLDTLLAAHSRLWQSGRMIPLVIAGIATPGEVFDFDHPGIIVVTHVAHDDVMAAWTNATIGVVPSAWGEPFRQVAVECLAAGTPLVVTRVGGLPDIVDNGACGLIVEAGQPDELADAMIRLIDDETLARRLAETGRLRAQSFTASAVQTGIEQCYQRVIAAGTVAVSDDAVSDRPASESMREHALTPAVEGLRDTPSRASRVFTVNTHGEVPLRIVHFSDNYPPSKGGLEHSVQSLAEAQAKAGHSVAVVTTELRGMPDRYQDAGVTVHRLPFRLNRIPGAYRDDQHVFFPPIPDPFFERAALQVIDDHGADVIHVHGWIIYSVLRPARTRKIPIVATAHDHGFVCAIKTLYRNAEVCSGPSMGKCISCSYASYGMKGIPLSVGLQLAGRSHSQVQEWIAVSHAVARAGIPHGVGDLHEVSVIPCLLPDAVLEFDRNAPRPEFVPANGPYLMYAGGLSKPKGVDTLLEAHQLLWSSGVQIPLVIAGLPSPGEEFDFALPGVTIATDVDHSTVMAAWVNATAGVVPSACREAFGQVALECIAVGTPVIVTRMGGLPEIVDGGKYGLVVEPSEPKELAKAIRQLIDDPELRDRLSSNGPKRAQLYSASVVLREVDRCYRRAIQTARRSSAS